MKHLPSVTLVCITTKDYGPSIVALQKTLQHIQPARVLYFSDVPYLEDQRIRHIPIAPFRSVKDYNRFVVKELGKHVDNGHILLIQHDGYVLDSSAWTDEFLNYDYIGAPWTYTDGRNVGNGGFSLRSARLHHILANDPAIEMYSPEDEVICRFYRQYLEDKHGIIYAPEELAHRFSYEMHRPNCRTFGFHNHFHQPYREPVIVQRRNSAMGDIIMAEPLMERLYNDGYRVILDIPPPLFNLFAQHHYPLEHLMNVNPAEVQECRVVNLEMAYEVKPKQLVLKSYYEVAGIPDGTLRNSRLRFNAPADKQEMRMFEKYIVLHVDDTAMPHRNTHGINWEMMAEILRVNGWPVFRVGKGNGTGGQKINTFSENMLGYIVANADYFIGIDSGCAQVAVASNVPSMIFFGSVRPEYRYYDLSNIRVMQHRCPGGKDGCYHELISEVGQDCQVDVQVPPCINWRDEDVWAEIKRFIPMDKVNKEIEEVKFINN